MKCPVKVAEEDGIALEPFNLKQERAEGRFDESGHYVEHARDDAASRDAWFDSGARRRVAACPASRSRPVTATSLARPECWQSCWQ